MRRCALVLLFGLTSLLKSCVPGVSWLPDSSDFVFTSPHGDLVAYNVATKKQRVLLHDRAAATTCWPAVSPSGKRIALAQLQDSDDRTQAILQIVVCDMQGKIEFRSDKTKFASFTGTDLRYSTQLVWSPDEKRILLHGQGMPNGGTGFESSALFEIASKKLEVWDNFVPAYFGGSPASPDGRGFLLVNMQAQNDYNWVDWTGNRKTVNFTGSDRNEFNMEPISPWTALYDSRWDGAKAILNTPKHKHSYVIDTQKLQLTVEKNPEAESKIGKELIHLRAKLASGVELLLLVQDDGNRSGPAVRLVSRKHGNPNLTEVLAPIRDQMIQLNLSPDHKHAVVRTSYGHRGAKGDLIFVINNSGSLHDTITVKERGGPSAKYEAATEAKKAQRMLTSENPLPSGLAGEPPRMNNFRQLGLGVLHYETAYRKFPFLYKQNLNEDISWRIKILPFIEQGAMYNNMDVKKGPKEEPNSTFAESMPAIFGQGGKLSNVSWIKSKVDTFGAITDGSSNTIMLLENPNGRPWLEDNPLTVDEAIELVSGLEDGAALVAVRYDCSTFLVTNEIAKEELRSLFEPNDGK